jgi:hypothetical protein
MIGTELLTYLQRRLAENGLTLETGRTDTQYDALTEGRDDVKMELALVAPSLFVTRVTLEVADATLNTFRIPAASKDPLRTDGVFLRCSNEERILLTPAAQLNRDDGDYVFTSPRIVQFKTGLTLPTGGSYQLDAVLHDAAITAATTEAQVGLPTPCHRAIAKRGAVLMLTSDEESDATNAEKDYGRELEKLTQLYGSYDTSDGMKLRHALMASVAAEYGEMLP